MAPKRLRFSRHATVRYPDNAKLSSSSSLPIFAESTQPALDALDFWSFKRWRKAEAKTCCLAHNREKQMRFNCKSRSNIWQIEENLGKLKIQKLKERFKSKCKVQRIGAYPLYGHCDTMYFINWVYYTMAHTSHSSQITCLAHNNMEQRANDPSTIKRQPRTASVCSKCRLRMRERMELFWSFHNYGPLFG